MTTPAFDHKTLSRFWSKVDKTGSLFNGSPCWLWTAPLESNGYGRMSVKCKNVLVHRLSYAAHHGAIPDGLCLDHLCRVRHCVNPAHLEPVSLGENVLRGISTHAINAAKTHCKHGHAFTEENTYRSRNGYRHCKICLREKQRQRTSTTEGRTYQNNAAMKSYRKMVSTPEGRAAYNARMKEAARKRKLLTQQ